MEPSGQPLQRGPGRPRKWASEAERKRAYRERLAGDLAEPAQLRRDLRAARKRIGELERALADLRRDHGRAARALERCAEQRDRRAEDAAALRAQVRDLRDRVAGGLW